MPVRNSYPDKPIVPFQKTPLEMGVLIDAIKKLNVATEIKRTAYIITRNESSNGKSVINGTNAWGVQSDSGRWSGNWDSKIVATCVKKENLTGKERGFVVFDTLASGFAFLCEKIASKGLFIGEKVNDKYYKGEVKTPQDLAVAYNRSWVYGGSTYEPTKDEINSFVSMYNQAAKLFP